VRLEQQVFSVQGLQTYLQLPLMVWPDYQT
jgi:hypothetical protein